MKQLLSALLIAAVAPLAQAAELVMVEQAGCSYCDQWDEEIGGIYHKTAEGKLAPLRRVDIFDLPDNLAFDNRPQFTPTFILFDGEREVGRIEGYPGDDYFFPLLGRLLEKLPAASG